MSSSSSEHCSVLSQPHSILPRRWPNLPHPDPTWPYSTLFHPDPTLFSCFTLPRLYPALGLPYPDKALLWALPYPAHLPFSTLLYLTPALPHPHGVALSCPTPLCPSLTPYSTQTHPGPALSHPPHAISSDCFYIFKICFFFLWIFRDRFSWQFECIRIWN